MRVCCNNVGDGRIEVDMTAASSVWFDGRGGQKIRNIDRNVERDPSPRSDQRLVRLEIKNQIRSRSDQTRFSEYLSSSL